MFCYEYPRPALTSDIILFRYQSLELQTLLIQRRDEPFAGKWAFAGGFVNEDETAEAAAHRELLEETGLSDISLEQLFTVSTPGRDPRGWTVSVVFTGFFNSWAEAKAGDDALNLKWYNINNIPALAFDHDILFQEALKYLRNRIQFSVLGLELLPKMFSENELTTLFDQVLKDSSKANLYINRLFQSGVITQNASGISFNPNVYANILNKGYFSLD